MGITIKVTHREACHVVVYVKARCNGDHDKTIELLSAALAVHVAETQRLADLPAENIERRGITLKKVPTAAEAAARVQAMIEKVRAEAKAQQEKVWRAYLREEERMLKKHRAAKAS